MKSGLTDDKLSLLYEINKTSIISVKTQAGFSERTTVNNIICQGDPWGSIECSLQTDGFGKESLNPQLEPYKYKDEVPIPALGVVDDLITVSESGYKSAKMNSFINAKTAIKKLQFCPDKCHVIHVGRNQEAYKNVDHYVEGWKMQEVQDIFTGEPHIEEAYDALVMC